MILQLSDRVFELSGIKKIFLLGNVEKTTYLISRERDFDYITLLHIIIKKWISMLFIIYKFTIIKALKW
jgi:hypothetical protein